MEVSDCCGAPMGELLDIEICPTCREHCTPVELCSICDTPIPLNEIQMRDLFGKPICPECANERNDDLEPGA